MKHVSSIATLEVAESKLICETCHQPIKRWETYAVYGDGTVVCLGCWMKYNLSVYDRKE